ncbi:MAG: hypothetical protein ACI9CE_003693 [Flavobacterium sp.]|jgi:hypothetical protein
MRARFNPSFKIQAVEKAFSRRGDTTLKEVADSLGSVTPRSIGGRYNPGTQNSNLSQLPRVQVYALCQKRKDHRIGAWKRSLNWLLRAAPWLKPRHFWCSKKSPSDLGKQRGRLTVSAMRDGIVSLINDARSTGARQASACEVVGISAKTYQRWNRRDNVGDSRQDTLHTPVNKLSALERQCIIKLVNEPA